MRNGGPTTTHQAEPSAKDVGTEASTRAMRRPLSAKAWILIIVAAILILIVYYALLDRYTPFTTEAYIQAYVNQVAPQVGGRVVGVHVKDNQAVKAGEVLFEIDPRPYAYAVNQLEAELVLARKDVTQLESDLKASNELIAQTQADLTYAQKAFERYSQSAAAGASPEIQLDQATDRLSSKQALLLQVQADRDKVSASLTALIGDENALIAKVQAELNKARYDLEQTKVFAPADGFITNLQLSVGTYISAGTQVMSFVDGDDWWIVANFRENSLVLMRPGQRAQIATGLYPGHIFDAVVESVGWGVGEGQGVPSGDLPDVTAPTDWVKVAQRFPVRLRLHPPDDDFEMRVGGSVTVAVYNTDELVLNGLAKLWLNIASVLNFIY